MSAAIVLLCSMSSGLKFLVSKFSYNHFTDSAFTLATTIFVVDLADLNFLPIDFLVSLHVFLPPVLWCCVITASGGIVPYSFGFPQHVLSLP